MEPEELFPFKVGWEVVAHSDPALERGQDKGILNLELQPRYKMSLRNSLTVLLNPLCKILLLPHLLIGLSVKGLSPCPVYFRSGKLPWVLCLTL